MSKAEIIARYINENNYKVYVEVGVWKGDNIAEIARLCPNLKTLIGIDPYTSYENATERSVCSCLSNEEYKAIQKEALEKTKNDKRIRIINAFNNDVNIFNDITFIDGSHDYENVKKDILHWLPQINKGGLLCGHDYCDYYSGVKQAVNELLTNVLLKDFKLWFHFVYTDQDV